MLFVATCTSCNFSYLFARPRLKVHNSKHFCIYFGGNWFKHSNKEMNYSKDTMNLLLADSIVKLAFMFSKQTHKEQIQFIMYILYAINRIRSLMFVCQSKLCLSVLIVSIFLMLPLELIEQSFFKKCRACIFIHSIEFSVLVR